MYVENYDSIREVRYYCENGGPTIEGSIPLSHQPTLNHTETMYAIKNADGLYLTEDGEYVSGDEVRRIKWFKWYLQAEESVVGQDCTVIDAVALLEKIINIKDAKLAELTIMLDKKQEAHDFIQNLYIVKRRQAELLKIELDKVIQAHNTAKGHTPLGL